MYMKLWGSLHPQSKANRYKEEQGCEHLDYWIELLMDKLPTGDKSTFFQNILNLNPAFT